MLVHAIVFDANMPVAAALGRLARYGIWGDPKQPDAWDWIREQARRSVDDGKEPTDAEINTLAARLAETNPERFGAAIRRQWYQNVLWYPMPIRQLLAACSGASRDTILLIALNLHEDDSRPSQVLRPDVRPTKDGVVLDNGRAAAVSLMTPDDRRPGRAGGRSVRQPTVMRGMREDRSAGASVATAPRIVSAWPRVQTEQYVAALKPFSVTVGFAADQQPGVSGAKVNLPAAPGAATIDVTVDLIADGFDAPNGWSAPLKVPVDDPTSASVSITLVGREPRGPQPVRLTTIEVRYVVEGTICGTASTPIVVGPSDGTVIRTPENLGAPWLGEPPTSSAGDFGADVLAPDLTVELAKPNGNHAEGDYICKLYSRHQLQTATGPFDVHLRQDAKTFAHSVIQGVRQYNGDILVNRHLRSVGRLVTEVLPPELFDALAEVAGKVKPEPPAVLFVSAEPFVPWELAFLDQPLFDDLPPFLGAQTLLGRWFRDPRPAPAASSNRLQRPPTQPPTGIPVRHMAAMAGMYKPATGLRNLPAAEAEVDDIGQQHNAVLLAASSQNVDQLLDGRLERQAREIGPAGAIHFAGHGQFDPAVPDSSVLYLSNGVPLSSMLFRDANYGGPHQPIIFFNACMIGVGGEVLGDMGGFPGNCLRGGFGAVLGALWEIDDTVARNIALEFWSRALGSGNNRPEPVASVLRDLRAQYLADQPVPTFMAYTFYGHPRLTLTRVS